MTQKPKETFRAGLVKAAIFEKLVKGSKSDFTSQSVTLQTSYQKSGEWQNRNLTLIKKNVRNAISVLEQAAQEMGV